MRVTGGSHHLDDPFADRQDADIERATAKVEDQHRFVLELVHAVRQSCCGGLVDDAEYLQTSYPSRILGRLALRVVEVGGHGDHGLGDPLTEVLACVVDQLAEHLRRNLLGGVLLAMDVKPYGAVGPGHDIEGDGIELAGYLVVLATHEPLRGVDGALRVQDRLPPRHLPNKPLARLEERDHRRCGPVALGVRDDLGLSAFPRRNDRVGRTKINAYCRCHGSLPITDCLI